MNSDTCHVVILYWQCDSIAVAMKAEKLLMLILDGMPDRPVPEIGMKTPLQAAKKPGFDRIVKEGAGGIMDVIGTGIVPGSDTAHLALFGYDPFRCYSGRGPFEAAGVGIECRPGDVAFRCNFATVDDKIRVIDRRAGRIREGTSELAKSLSGMKIDGIEVIFREATEHRAVLVLRGKGLDPRVSDVDPHEENSRILRSRPLSPEATLTANVLNGFVTEAYTTLMKNPVNLERASKGLPVANMILPRGAGKLMKLERFSERFEMKPAGIAGVSLIKGVFRILGFDTINVKGATGGIDTDIDAKMRAALTNLESYDMVAVNVKAPDIAGHDGDCAKKIEVIERIDASLQKVLKELPEKALIAVLSDHSTPVSLRNHSADPVCIAVRGKGVRIDDVSSFDEISCSQGALRGMRGMDLIGYFRGILGRAEKFGA